MELYYACSACQAVYPAGKSHCCPSRVCAGTAWPAGWECPKCGRVYGPAVVVCGPCCEKAAAAETGAAPPGG